MNLSCRIFGHDSWTSSTTGIMYCNRCGYQNRKKYVV